jgi:hypothetical protein
MGMLIWIDGNREPELKFLTEIPWLNTDFLSKNEKNKVCESSSKANLRR